MCSDVNMCSDLKMLFDPGLKLNSPLHHIFYSDSLYVFENKIKSVLSLSVSGEPESNYLCLMVTAGQS